MGINYKRLLEEYTKQGGGRGPEKADAPHSNGGRWLAKAFKEKGIRPDEIELGWLLEECLGSHNYRLCRSKVKPITEALREAAGALGTSSFMNITGQIVYSALMDAYAIEDFVFSKLIPDMPSQFINQEKMAGISNIGDEALVRPEGSPYPAAGVTEDWIELPAAQDRGEIISLTFEAVFSDRTGGRLVDQCRKVGDWLGVNKEKRIIDAVIDENAGAVSTPYGHRYKRRGTFIASYGNNSGTHDWDNLEASNALVDWTDLNNAEQLLNGMTDPNTGEPFVAEAKHLIVTKQLEPTARHILFSDQIAITTPGFATSGAPNQMWVDNQWRSKYQVVTSRLLAARLATDTDWFLGDLSKAFKYKVIEPINVVQAPPNTDLEFRNRIVLQWRANEFGAAATVEPRLIVKSTA